MEKVYNERKIPIFNQGEDVVILVTLINRDTWEPIDLTGVTQIQSMHAHKTKGQDHIVRSISGGHIEIVTAALGKIKITIPKTTSVNLKAEPAADLTLSVDFAAGREIYEIKNAYAVEELPAGTLA